MNRTTFPHTAVKVMLILLAAIILFHIAVTVKLIPYDIVWGGRITSNEQLLTAEVISITINLLLIAILLLKADYIRHTLPQRWLNITLWAYVVLFALNTAGNLMAENQLEKIMFTPVTLLFVILLIRIAVATPEKRG
ncbi:hypothetical protein ECE50_001855 [Chitinophaga sp. Mgbs1]|uniref:Uncharacterized protein n=1 Tax=Chitinophaga solisilvae TaxID=1233460 RepID=A0A9Q5D5X2_9BACT|nr:hypothetical protein [Chitinophaga solisilvae]